MKYELYVTSEIRDKLLNDLYFRNHLSKDFMIVVADKYIKPGEMVIVTVSGRILKYYDDFNADVLKGY